MAEHGSMVLTSIELSDVDVTFPNEQTAILTYHVKQSIAARGNGESYLQEMNDTSTWIHTGKQWKCVMHTETKAVARTDVDMAEPAAERGAGLRPSVGWC